MTVDEWVEVNRRRWDEMAALHETTYFAPDSWIRDSALKPFERAEIGDVTGQRVCHLQCHLGGESLALAQLGAAVVVGVDFSTVAIEQARARASSAGLNDRVTFVCATVDEAVERTDGAFDGVYTSWGVLCWLPDINAWARTIASLLVDGGWFYLAETHPHAAALRWAPRYGGEVGVFDDGQGDYTDAEAVFEHPESWEWNHGIGEVVTALVSAGLRIGWLHERASVAWHLNDEANIQQQVDGMWAVPGSTLPLSFSLRAVKE